jgi:hypothetical protein
LLQVVSLWLLADPVLGTLWELAGPQGLWRRVIQAQLPPPPARGLVLPYTQPESAAGRLALLARRYGAWWRGSYWPEFGGQVTTFVLGLVLALVIGAALGWVIFWLVVLTLNLILLAGLSRSDLAAAGGGRLQAVVQLLLPWLMGSMMWSRPGLFGPMAAICYWISYLGGLRMAGGHKRAELLFFSGQVGAMLLLFGLRLLPGATGLGVLFVAQLLIWNRFDRPAGFLEKAQPYLIASLIVAGWSLGSLQG